MNQPTKYLLFVLILTITACKKDDTANTTPTTTTVPDVYKLIYGASDMYVEGNNVVIKLVNNIPDHKSPYFKGTTWESTLYEAYNGTNTKWGQAPNKIAAQNLTFKLPLNPVKATNSTQTPLGPMGISLNGVPFFNQYAAGRAALTNEVNGFDQYGGHPQQQGQYHYHVEPTYLTKNKGKDALLGFLLDGFPVYGPVENGKTILSKDLDAFHGHVGVTKEYPNGIYHYHITADDPYINGSGFYGTAGTVN